MVWEPSQSENHMASARGFPVPISSCFHLHLTHYQVNEDKRRRTWQVHSCMASREDNATPTSLVHLQFLRIHESSLLHTHRTRLCVMTTMKILRESSATQRICYIIHDKFRNWHDSCKISRYVNHRRQLHDSRSISSGAGSYSTQTTRKSCTYHQTWCTILNKLKSGYTSQAKLFSIYVNYWRLRLGAKFWKSRKLINKNIRRLRR
jgi:hypothetical protein